ncbi:hypothetical protein [Streptococcus rupicaprae]|uniref:hypothetical protein n=1 Tax=Streptococcus rupicaprae TaxID=759619 RepID=UPI00339785F1
MRLQIRKTNDIIRVLVEDNGSGLDSSALHNHHLGLMIVDRFVKSRLSGKWRMTSDKRGTATMITFQ